MGSSPIPRTTEIPHLSFDKCGISDSCILQTRTCFASKAGAVQYAVYVLGNLFSVLSLLMVKKMGKDKIRSGVFFSFLYATVVFLLMAFGRGVVSLILGKGAGALVDFLTTDVLSWVFALVIIWIVRRLDGVFEDQISYLVRLKSDEEKEKGGKDEG